MEIFLVDNRLQECHERDNRERRDHRDSPDSLVSRRQGGHRSPHWRSSWHHSHSDRPPADGDQRGGRGQQGQLLPQPDSWRSAPVAMIVTSSGY